MKMYNAVIYYGSSDGTRGVSLTSDLETRLLKFNQTYYSLFGTIHLPRNMTADEIVDYLQDHQMFTNDESLMYALRNKRKKTKEVKIKTTVTDVLQAINTIETELV